MKDFFSGMLILVALFGIVFVLGFGMAAMGIRYDPCDSWLKYSNTNMVYCLIGEK